jgi:hypothetical protein
VSVAFGVLALVCVYAVARAAFGHAVALLALLAVAMTPSLTELSCDPLSDAPGVALALASVAIGLQAARQMRRARWRAVPLAAAAGLLAGLGYLMRPEELLAGGIVLLLILPVGRVAKGGRAVAAASLAALLVLLTACVVPYAAAVGGLTQKKALSDFVGAAPGLDGLLATASTAPGTLGAFWSVLDRGRAAMGTGVFVLTTVCWLTWMVHYLLRVRLPEAVLLRPRRDVAVAMAAAALVMLPLLTALELQRATDGRYVSSRHLMLPAMLLAPAAGAGVVVLVAWVIVLMRRLGRRERPGLATGLVLLGVFAGLSVRALPTLHEGKAPLRAAGLAVSGTFGEPARGLVGQFRIALYAGSPPGQFRRDRAGRFRLRPQDIRSARALLRRAQHAGRISYVAIDRPLLSRSPNPDILGELADDPRFVRLGVFGVGEKSEVHVFVPSAAGRAAATAPNAPP